MKNKVPCCVINVMLSTTTKLMQQKLFTWKELCVFILYKNKKLLIYHFHQETNSIVHLVEIVMYFVIFNFSFLMHVCQLCLSVFVPLYGRL